MADTQPVLFVHGLWMTGLESLLLRHRLGTYGLSMEAFRYGSTSSELSDVLAGLAESITALGSRVGLLGHSLGGLVILRFLEQFPALLTGPIVLMGSPVNGSQAARGIARLPGASWLLGDAAASELLMTPARRWDRATPLGVLAGDMPLGFGAVVSHLAVPHDGAVAVDETRLEGATDMRIFHVNHMGMLTSAAVARAAAGFLSSGHFPD